MDLFLEGTDHVEEYSSTLLLEHNPDYSTKLNKFLDIITKEYPEWNKLCTFSDDKKAVVIQEKKLGDVIFGIKVASNGVKVYRYKGGPEYDEWGKKAANTLSKALQVFVEKTHRRIAYIDIRFDIMYEDIDGSLSEKLFSFVNPDFIKVFKNGATVRSSQFTIEMPRDCLLAIALGKESSEGDTTSFLQIGYAQQYSNNIKTYNKQLINKIYRDGKKTITEAINSIYRG